jgi:hypothetical protein
MEIFTANMYGIFCRNIIYSGFILIGPQPIRPTRDYLSAASATLDSERRGRWHKEDPAGRGHEEDPAGRGHEELPADRMKRI